MKHKIIQNTLFLRRHTRKNKVLFIVSPLFCLINKYIFNKVFVYKPITIIKKYEHGQFYEIVTTWKWFNMKIND